MKSKVKQERFERVVNSPFEYREGVFKGYDPSWKIDEQDKGPRLKPLNTIIVLEEVTYYGAAPYNIVQMFNVRNLEGVTDTVVHTEVALEPWTGYEI